MFYANKQLALAAAISAGVALTGCDGSSSNEVSGGGQEPISITGTAEAPAGAIASLEPLNPVQVALNYLVSPAAAGITGLQPVAGATVDLIRVNDAGEQQGNVLASGVTSITGEYDLEIPAGTSLAGNLVVRIQGSETELRAQAVDQDVDINPISEYVLRKFIEKGTELSTLTTTSVIELTGKAEEFDIAATSNLDTMIEALETEMGDFIEGQVTQITSGSSDVTEIAGKWHSSALEFGLADSDGQGGGSLFVDSFGDEFTFSNGGSGLVSISVTDLGKGEASLTGFDGNALLNYVTEVESGQTETVTANYLNGGIMTLDFPFEESIEGDFGFRYPPGILQFQKAAGNNVMFLIASDPLVRYHTVDTNGDNEPDAIDPDDKDGDEILYSIETFIKKPSAATAEGLAGDFGRVYFGAYLQNNVYEVENELNIITFQANSTLDVGPEEFLSLSHNGITTETKPAESGLSFILSGDGNIDSVADEPANIWVDDALNLVVANEFEGASGDFAELSKTVMVRLPKEDAPLDLSDRNYRVKFLAISMFGAGGVELLRSRFDSTMSFVDNTSASIDLKLQAASKDKLAGEISVTTERFEDSDAAVTVNPNGSATVTIGSAEDGGVTTGEGFLNQDGSIGIFRTHYDEDGEGEIFQPSELGIMILAELP